MQLSIIVGTVVYVVAATLLFQGLAHGTWRRMGVSPLTGYRWWRALLVGLALGATLAFGALCDLPPSWVGGVALFSIVFLTFVLGHRLSKLRRFARGLDDACRDPSNERIESLLSLRRPPKDHAAYATWVAHILLAARRAHDLGQTERAVGWLGAIDPRRVLYENGLELVLARASFALSLGRRDEARDVLRYLPPELKSPAFEKPFAIVRALVAVLDGDASDARFRDVQTARARATDPSSADGWAAVEVHLRAARGDIDGAVDVLRAMVRDGRLATVQRIERHRGPASPLAARALDGTPYR